MTLISAFDMLRDERLIRSWQGRGIYVLEPGQWPASVEDMTVLYSGFDLCAPATSVSMTINGAAPAILAMFLNTAIDQRLDSFRAEHGREPGEAEAQEIRAWV